MRGLALDETGDLYTKDGGKVCGYRVAYSYGRSGRRTVYVHARKRKDVRNVCADHSRGGGCERRQLARLKAVRNAYAYACAHDHFCRLTYVLNDVSDGVVAYESAYLPHYRACDKRTEQSERHARKRVYEIPFYGIPHESFKALGLFRLLLCRYAFRLGDSLFFAYYGVLACAPFFSGFVVHKILSFGKLFADSIPHIRF